MKIYDMIEGVWLKEKVKTEEKKKEKREKPDLAPRLVTHDEEKKS